jgi:photosystem II stability/assembly factor-like uncharacterized protein
MVSTYAPIAGASSCKFAGPITVASPTAGWLPVTCSAPEMLATRDGGATWQLQHLPNGIFAPTFFDATPGVAINDGADNAGLLITSDGGATWKSLPLPTTGCALYISCNGNSPSFDFVDANNFWDFVMVLPPKSRQNVSTPAIASFFRSSDGGKSWKLVQANIHISSTNGSPANVMSVVMADDQHGLIGAQVQDVSGQPVYELLSTSDGGHTWKVINPQIAWAS